MAAIRPWLRVPVSFLKNLMMAVRRLNYNQQNQVYYVIDVYSKGREIFKNWENGKICIKIIPYKVSSW